jgi:galactitol-specific phosphotransferase system IIB component
MASGQKIKKKVMLVCGSGIVSCTLIMPPVEEILESSPFRCELIKGRFHDIPSRIDNLDLILTTVPLQDEFDLKGVPVVIVMGLFGGGNKEEIRKQIHEALAGS